MTSQWQIDSTPYVFATFDQSDPLKDAVLASRIGDCVPVERSADGTITCSLQTNTYGFFRSPISGMRLSPADMEFMYGPAGRFRDANMAVQLKDGLQALLGGPGPVFHTSRDVWDTTREEPPVAAIITPNSKILVVVRTVDVHRVNRELFEPFVDALMPCPQHKLSDGRRYRWAPDGEPVQHYTVFNPIQDQYE